MSGVDQPVVIANSNYHVGQERSWRAAEEQGFVKEEGLDRYVYQAGGLIPGKCEFHQLARQMWERGVDIVTAVDARAAVLQRARGGDVYIVGGWRSTLEGKIVGAKGMTRPEELKGSKSVTRETWGLAHIGIATALRRFGVGYDDVEWIEGIVDFEAEERGTDLLRSGEVTFVTVNGREADRLIEEGYPLLLNLGEFYRGLGGWPPGKVIVTTKQMIDERGEELRAFLRASLRGFWFTQDLNNHSFMYDLETRLRLTTYNEYERRIRMLADPTPPPPRKGPTTMGSMVMDGFVPRDMLVRMIDDMVQFGDLDRPIDVDEVLKEQPSIDAFENLVKRGLVDMQVLDGWRSVTYGKV